MKLTINVQPRKDDSTNVCTMCPVAQALRDAVGLERATMATASRFDAFAQPSRLYAKGAKYMIVCDAPAEVIERIRRWDETGKMEPFSFEVDAAPSGSGEPSREFFFPGCMPPTMRPLPEAQGANA